jgi:O-antigen/teichoic acid export membrane protein
MVEKLAPQAAGFIFSILIARILGPSAYGLIGMLAVFMALGNAFGDLAFSAALVQRKTITVDDETSVFWVNIASGLALTVLLCLISPLVARFYRQAILVPLLCFQSFSILISSFGIVQLALITRSMSFKSNALIETVSCVLSGLVGISMARFEYGVWSLVGLNLSRQTFRVVLLWAVRDWRPRGRFCPASMRSMWAYSSKLLYSSIFHQVVTNLNSIVIGRVYSPADLGIYTRAGSLQSIPTSILAGIVQRVAFPLFSRRQDEPAILLSAIRRQIRVLIFFATGSLAVLAVVADQLIPFLLGSKWNGVIPLLRILCLGGVLASIFPLHSEMLKALGKSTLFFRIEMLKKAVIVFVIFTVYRYGISALAWGAVVISAADYLITAYPIVKAIRYSWKMQAQDILPPIFLAGIAAVCVMQINWAVLSVPPLYIIAAKASIFAILLAGGTIALRNVFFADVWGLVASFLRTTRQASVSMAPKRSQG